MNDLHHIAPLPPARTLDRGRQVRLLMLAAAAIVLVFVVISIVRWATTPRPETPVAAVPGTLRVTPEQLRQLKTMTVGDTPDDRQVDATGLISVDEDHSTPVLLPYSGQVAAVFVQAGQHVVRGQPLLTIASADVVEARNALAAAQAQRATAAAQLKIASDSAARQQAIYQTAGGALKDFRQSQSDVVVAQSALASANAALAAARDKLALFGQSGTATSNGGGNPAPTQTVYHSPVAGTVASRDVAPGQYVGAGGDKPVMTIADLSRVWLIAQLAESDAASVHVGDQVQVVTPAYPGRVFDARIDNIAAQLDPATHRLPVRATVANPDLALKPQMFARFAIRRASDAQAGNEAIRIPSAAVIHEGHSARVWVVGANGLLHVQPVQVSDSTDATDTIASGLKRGDRIVTAGALFVNEAGSGA